MTLKGHLQEDYLSVNLREKRGDIMRKITCVIVFAFACFSVLTFVLAQEEVATVSAEVSGAANEAKTVAATASTPGNVTLDFKDADITNVLRILSYKSGVNIVAGKDVAGPVTIRLTDVPWDKALDVILRTYGYMYEREGNIIRVTTTENLEMEELVTEVFSLNYANAAEVPDAIEEMLSDRGSVKHDARANLIIVTDIAPNIYKIRQVVAKLDMRTQQVNIEAKISEIGYEDAAGEHRG